MSSRIVSQADFSKGMLGEKGQKRSSGSKDGYVKRAVNVHSTKHGPLRKRPPLMGEGISSAEQDILPIRWRGREFTLTYSTRFYMNFFINRADSIPVNLLTPPQTFVRNTAKSRREDGTTDPFQWAFTPNGVNYGVAPNRDRLMGGGDKLYPTPVEVNMLTSTLNPTFALSDTSGLTVGGRPYPFRSYGDPFVKPSQKALDYINDQVAAGSTLFQTYRPERVNLREGSGANRRTTTIEAAGYASVPLTSSMTALPLVTTVTSDVAFHLLLRGLPVNEIALEFPRNVEYDYVVAEDNLIIYDKFGTVPPVTISYDSTEEKYNIAQGLGRHINLSTFVSGESVDLRTREITSTTPARHGLFPNSPQGGLQVLKRNPLESTDRTSLEDLKDGLNNIEIPNFRRGREGTVGVEHVVIKHLPLTPYFQIPSREVPQGDGGPDYSYWVGTEGVTVQQRREGEVYEYPNHGDIFKFVDGDAPLTAGEAVTRRNINSDMITTRSQMASYITPLSVSTATSGVVPPKYSPVFFNPITRFTEGSFQSAVYRDLGEYYLEPYLTCYATRSAETDRFFFVCYPGEASRFSKTSEEAGFLPVDVEGDTRQSIINGSTRAVNGDVVRRNLFFRAHDFFPEGETTLFDINKVAYHGGRLYVGDKTNTIGVSQFLNPSILDGYLYDRVSIDDLKGLENASYREVVTSGTSDGRTSVRWFIVLSGTLILAMDSRVLVYTATNGDFTAGGTRFSEWVEYQSAEIVPAVVDNSIYMVREDGKSLDRIEFSEGTGKREVYAATLPIAEDYLKGTTIITSAVGLRDGVLLTLNTGQHLFGLKLDNNVLSWSEYEFGSTFDEVIPHSDYRSRLRMRGAEFADADTDKSLLLESDVQAIIELLHPSEWIPNPTDIMDNAQRLSEIAAYVNTDKDSVNVQKRDINVDEGVVISSDVKTEGDFDGLVIKVDGTEEFSLLKVNMRLDTSEVGNA